jgi:hypothetical protein
MKRFLIKIGIVILICMAVVIVINKRVIISCPNVEVFTASTTSPLVILVFNQRNLNEGKGGIMNMKESIKMEYNNERRKIKVKIK